MNLQKVWKVKNSQSISQELIDAAGNEVVARLLYNRGLDSAVKIINFLNPLKMSFMAPSVFIDMDKTVARIKNAIEKNENITVYGDFDADGITSTAVLYKTLETLGAKVNYYLPDRESESHGLNTKALINIISKRKTKLIITVDCGIGNIEEVNFASSFKADVIITDHHEAPEVLPNAFAIINPKAQNALKEDLSIDELQSLSYLAGVGVAFKLSCALLEEFNKTEFVDELLPLVAVGTIADVVPLLGENRAFVTMGLELIKVGKNLGINELLKGAGVNETTVTSETVAFTVAPRLNAAGRLDSAEKALNLLISKDMDNIQESVFLLNSLNSERQDMCDNIFREAVAIIEKNPEKYKSSVILFNENWHLGIIGIVASKLIEKYNRPVFLMTRDNENKTVVRCSCRSISAINIYDVLSAHSEYFIKFGGHSMAAGFNFDENVISFEDFSQLLNNAIEIILESVDLLPVLEIDAEIDTKDIDMDLIENIEKLQPFGACNSSPVFALKNLRLAQYKFMGQNSNHLKLYAVSSNNRQFECVKWNTSEFNVPLNSAIDIAFYPKINEFNGNVTIQLDLKDIKSDAIKKNKAVLKILDHRRKTNILDQVVEYVNTSKKQIALFIEDRKTEEKFLKYDKIKSKIFNRQSIPENTDQIMFFDCPPDSELFCKILSSTKADTVHLMNFDSESLGVVDFIKQLSGMLKYSSTKKDGNINLEELAKLTNTNNKIIQMSLKLFADSEMIGLIAADNSDCKVTFNTSVEFSVLRQNSLYKEIEDELSKIKEYRRKIHSGDIEDLEKLLMN